MSSTDEPAAILSPLLPQYSDKLDSVTALARFEFEPGRGNEATKVMMVEWQDEEKIRHTAGSWQVSWPGKKTTFSANDDDSSADNNNTCRLYFLLPPGATIPPHITISYHPPTTSKTRKTNGRVNEQDSDDSDETDSNESEEQQQPLRMNVTPLPAIFTPELGATAKASGKKGVLHTIWAKKRLRVLENEIHREKEFNLEGIALEMAQAEKKWIEQNFGVGSQVQKPLTLDMAGINRTPSSPPTSPGGISSPRTPGGSRRLTEKLKGLSLVTTDQGQSGVNTPTREFNPLSPEDGDVAVSSFSAFRGEPLSSSNKRGSGGGGTSTTAQQKRTTSKVVAQQPPESIRAQQAISPGLGLNRVVNAPAPGPTTRSTSGGSGSVSAIERESEKDLFAKALSPRSPHEPKSPFSMSSAEVGAFAKIKGMQPADTF